VEFCVLGTEMKERAGAAADAANDKVHEVKDAANKKADEIKPRINGAMNDAKETGMLVCITKQITHLNKYFFTFERILKINKVYEFFHNKIRK
jgi:nicotinamidase-related amidase